MSQEDRSRTAQRSFLIGLAGVAIAILLAAAGYRLGKHLADRDDAQAAQAAAAAPAPGH